ncbi:MAG: bifunctional metallophosphatase/5'-nucleotidase [Candidatus Sericytochromatia bacterium]|nr:bifunctional metallophosphatase/5'-nucleotidase [Candidatus Sericytochromatia bacterium]
MRRSVPLLLPLLLAMTLPLSAMAEELVILHTNDTHNHLQPFKDRDGSEVGGAAHRAAVIAAEKKSHPNNLVLDAGDVFQGTPLYTFFKGEVDMKAMSLVGYDAGALGNHDLDDGWANLKTQLKFAQFPMLCANVTTTDGDPVFLPAMTFLRGKIRVGVIGLMGAGAWNNVAVNSRKSLKFNPIVPAAKKWVAALRDRVDLLVLLTHNGLQEDQALAKEVPGVDVIVGGHSHSTVPKPILVPNDNQNGIGGTLVLQAGSYGRFAGRLTLDVEQGKITKYDGELIPITTQVAVTGNNAIDSMVAPYAAKVDTQMDQVIGNSPSGLSTAGKFGGETPLGSWLADMIRESGKAEIGIINSGGIRAELSAGPVTVRKVFEILPFENFVASMDLSGQTLIDLSAKVVERLYKQQAGTLQVSGMSFRGKDGKLVGPVLVKGKPIDPKRQYRVAIVDYLLGGGEGPYFDKHSKLTVYHELLRDLMIARVKTQKVLGSPDVGRIVIEPASH